MKKIKILTAIIAVTLMFTNVTAFANIQQPVPPWERLNFNYHFTSGGFDLGRPTTFDGIVPIDVFTVNVRVDSQVALRPPSYGVFSGVIPTEPLNPLMPQPLNPQFGGNFGTLDSFGDYGFLPPTSIR